ncbi:MAG TPA: hypothetical protein DCE42_07385, partial [Myxococcales bacterium]|nr:hypothetical protein [Myxococcales bacterium]
LEKEAGDDSLALLVEKAKMYLGAGKIQDALACYEAMHLYHRDVVDEEAELSRRVAAALLYKQGLELLEYAPEQALNKFEASYALDPEFFPKEIMRQMTTLREAKEKQRKVRFIGLCREGQHLSKTDPARALGKFNLAYRLAPQFWTENHTKWVQYLQKLVALQKERAQHDSVRHLEQQS